MPALRELALGVLQGRQHEQVAALVIAVVLPSDVLERLFERREVAHGRASVWPDVRGRTARGRNGCGSSSASSSTSRSEEHTSELQSRLHLVCRLLLEKKKKKSLRHQSS